MPANAVPASSLEARIKAVLAEKSLLKHPFYVEWTEGTLPLARLQEYARQYFHFEAAFPRFLSAIHARTESAAVRQHLLDNLWDEEHGDRNHLALWLDFGKALGLDPEEVRAGAPNAETTALVEHYRAASTSAPLAEALGTLYAYEGQVPAVAWEKIKGLKEFYGLEPADFEFFTTHLVADVAHSGSEVAAIRETCDDEDALVGAVEAACDRLLGFLDGCYAPADAPGALMAEYAYQTSEAWNTAVKLATAVGRLKVGSNLKAAADAQSHAFEQAGLAAALIADGTTREGPAQAGAYREARGALAQSRAWLHVLAAVMNEQDTVFANELDLAEQAARQVGGMLRVLDRPAAGPPAGGPAGAMRQGPPPRTGPPQRAGGQRDGRGTGLR